MYIVQLLFALLKSKMGGLKSKK
uniref:Uncharacterized protein n=1 Tax=Anguilla anguilla TaxID=7936 RepID=A0A0E9SY89_ANGAN